MERVDGGGMAQGGGVVGSAGMLGLDMHLPPQQVHHAAFQQQPDLHGHHGGGFQLQQPAPLRHQQQTAFSPYSTSSSLGVTPAAGHDGEEMAANGYSGKVGAVQQQQNMQVAGSGAAAGCPWTRMKWTDAMVRLLITVVYSVGDDGEGMAAGGKPAAQGKAGSSAAAQQKKGKWKSVSRAMMDKSFMVSPQQCEDKFNDLNKRYKRVVDLLGRGRACQVVENHALLDAIDDLSPRAKEEARKLLSSKHLFFREMCAYHNNAGAHAQPHTGAGDADCLHHPPPAPVAASSSASRQAAHAALSPPGMKEYSSADVAGEYDDSEDAVMTNNEDEDEDDFNEDDNGHMYPSHRLLHQHNANSGGSRKRVRGGVYAGEDLEDDAAGAKPSRTRPSAAVQQLRSELASAPATDPRLARRWVKRRAAEVEEEQLAVEQRAFQLERQRLKWERFRANKERDMERARLRNDRLRLDGRRMLLMLRHKELELGIAEANSHRQFGSSPSTGGHPN